MNYGLYLSASGVLTNLHRQDVIANNLANTSTVGFKRAMADFTQRDAEAIEDRLSPDVSHKLLDRLGGGTLVSPSKLNWQPGPLTQTGSDLHVAIDGDGRGFLVVQNEDGGLRLTRDGRLALDKDGTLRTEIGDLRVLGANDEPILLDRSLPIEVDSKGTIRQGGEAVARLQLVEVDRGLLTPEGKGLFTTDEQTLAGRQPADATVLQGWLEDSNVDPVRELLALIETSRAIQDGASLIRYHDSVMERAVNQLGRVSTG